jgi:hypothetical protein
MTISQEMPKLSDHQWRVLVALAELERAHRLRWWPREAIGQVVGAGGFHSTIQLKTIGRLKDLGLVESERSAWPELLRTAVRCGCACCNWGMTSAGRALVRRRNLPVAQHLLDEVSAISWRSEAGPHWLDEVEADREIRRRFRGDDNDDGGEDPAPAPVHPAPAPACV